MILYVPPARPLPPSFLEKPHIHTEKKKKMIGTIYTSPWKRVGGAPLLCGTLTVVTSRIVILWCWTDLNSKDRALTSLHTNCNRHRVQPNCTALVCNKPALQFLWSSGPPYWATASDSTMQLQRKTSFHEKRSRCNNVSLFCIAKHVIIMISSMAMAQRPPTYYIHISKR